jgi:cellulose synthase operon protein C
MQTDRWEDSVSKVRQPRSSTLRHLLPTLTAATLVLLLAACGGAEEREASYRQRGKNLFDQGEYAKAALQLRNALQIKPTSVEAIYYLGRISEAQGDHQAANAIYERVIQQDPAFVPALVKLGEFALLLNETDKAEGLAKRALEASSSSPSAQALNAAILSRQGKLAEAEAEATAALTAEPGNVRAISVLANLAARQGRTDQAVQILDAGLKHAPRDGGLRLIKIQVLTDAKRFGDVEKAFKDLVAAAPSNNTYKVYFARFLVTEGRLDDAEALFREAVAVAPEDKEVKSLLITFLVEKRGWQIAEKQLLQDSEQSSDFAPRFRLAELYAANKQVDRAKSMLQSIIERDAAGISGIAARPVLARIALADGRTAEAETLANETLRADPANAEALYVRASIAAARRDYQAAIADLRTILRNQPGAAPALALLARVYLADDEPQLALETYRALVAAVPNDVMSRVAFAERLRAAGRRDRALTELDEALKRSPNLLPALKGKALILIEQGAFALAESIGNLMLTQPTGESSGRFVLGAAAIQRRDYATAIRQLREAHAADSKSEEAVALLVVAYEAAGQRQAAVDYLEKVVAGDPSGIIAATLLADGQFKIGQAQKAEETLRRLIATGVTSAVPYLKLGSLYEHLGRLPDALKVIQEGLTVAPSTELQIKLALTQEALTDFNGARDTYEALLSKKPRHLAASNNLAALIADVWPLDTTMMGQARRLAEPFRESGDAALLDTLGWIQLRSGNLTDAIQILEQAARIEPKEQQIRYHLGLAYQAQGDLTRARAELEKAVSGTPSYRGLDEAKRALAAI